MKSTIWTIMLLCTLTSLWAQDDMKVPPRGKKAFVTIETDPPNSDVYLGGEFLGKSPIIKKQVPSGRHTLVVVDQGYELVNTRFNVWPDSNNVFSSKTVIPKGHIEVTTVPPKCRILLDGESADFTDGAALVIRNLDAGDHVVTAICGNRSKEVLVTVKGEETIKVTIDVTKK